MYTYVCVYVRVCVHVCKPVYVHVSIGRTDHEQASRIDNIFAHTTKNRSIVSVLNWHLRDHVQPKPVPNEQWERVQFLENVLVN